MASSGLRCASKASDEDGTLAPSEWALRRLWIRLILFNAWSEIEGEFSSKIVSSWFTIPSSARRFDRSSQQSFPEVAASLGTSIKWAWECYQCTCEGNWGCLRYAKCQEFPMGILGALHRCRSLPPHPISSVFQLLFTFSGEAPGRLTVQTLPLYSAASRIEHPYHYLQE